MAGLKMRFDSDNLGRLLMFPAKGKTSITLGDISSDMVNEVSNKFANGFVSTTTQEKARTDPSTSTLLDSGLRSAAQSALADMGATLDRVWISWTPSEHDRIVAMRQELEMMAEEGRLISEKNRLKWRGCLLRKLQFLRGNIRFT